MQSRCARFRAAIGQGTPVADFSLPVNQPHWVFIPSVCVHRVPLDDDMTKQPPPEKKVHKPVKGI
jgi:hypothetical protein